MGRENVVEQRGKGWFLFAGGVTVIAVLMLLQARTIIRVSEELTEFKDRFGVEIRQHCVLDYDQRPRQFPWRERLEGTQEAVAQFLRENPRAKVEGLNCNDEWRYVGAWRNRD